MRNEQGRQYVVPNGRRDQRDLVQQRAVPRCHVLTSFLSGNDEEQTMSKEQTAAARDFVANK